MRAFIRAMERRHAEGLPLDRHSVASFFVSRVDTEVDKRLDALGRTDLQGRAGLANARAAYQAFQRVFGGERVRRAARGRLPGPAPAVGVDRRQEPRLPRDAVRLRARRPDTVNTMPLPTLQAAEGDGEVTGATAAEDPTRRPGRARRGRHRPRRRHRPAAARGHRRVRRADEQAARRHRGQARGDRHRPPDLVRGRPAGRARAARRRAAAQGRARRTSCAGSGARTARCGRRPARRSSRTGSAG